MITSVGHCTYFLPSLLILQEMWPSALVAGNLQPVVCVGYFVAEVCCHGLTGMDIDHVFLQIFDLLALCSIAAEHRLRSLASISVASHGACCRTYDVTDLRGCA